MQETRILNNNSLERFLSQEGKIVYMGQIYQDDLHTKSGHKNIIFKHIFYCLRTCDPDSLRTCKLKTETIPGFVLKSRVKISCKTYQNMFEGPVLGAGGQGSLTI